MNSSKTWILWTPTVLLSCLSAFPCTPVHAMQEKTKPAKRSPGVNWWIYFESRESTKGKTPQLLITTRKGKSLRVKASADATLIQYLGKRSFGSMKMLAVGTMDKNRSLVNFVLPQSVMGKSIKKALLQLDMKLSTKPPKAPVELALHIVEQSWSERTVSWATQPRCAKKAFLNTELAPKAKLLLFDVTKIVNDWLSGKHENHGLLLKSKGRGTAAPNAAAGLPARLLKTIPWHDNTKTALAAADQQERLVLTLLRGAYRPNAAAKEEEILLATVFSDPSIIELVKHRFVPLRSSYVPTSYTRDLVRGKDPLADLGGDSTEIKAPAILVSTPDGELIALVETIGTFDSELIRNFLIRALDEEPELSDFESDDANELLAAGKIAAARILYKRMPAREAKAGEYKIAAMNARHARAKLIAGELAKGSDEVAADARVQYGISQMRLGKFEDARKTLSHAVAHKQLPTRLAEALYWLGSLQRVSGNVKGANASWARIEKDHPKSPWALKALARMAWPERLDPAENLRTVTASRDLETSTERAVAEKDVASLIERSVRFLVEQQRPDGSWPCEAEMYRNAVTALIAKGLDAWEGKLDKNLDKRVTVAIERAIGWIDKYLAETDAKDAFSFGSAYILDLLAGRYERTKDRKLKAKVATAIRFLEEGQCKDGAWSYSYVFGTRWRGGFGGWPKTDKGRTHSCNTGPAMVSLAKVKAQGFAIDEERFARGSKVLMNMRVAAGRYTYTWPLPLNFQRTDQSIARGPVCEHALLLSKAVKSTDLEIALDSFMKYKDGLRTPVKLDKSWATRENFSSYFYFFAYYHAALALQDLGNKKAKRYLAQIRKDILEVPELDATWVDYLQLGKPYGTAMALMLLAMTNPADK